MNKLKTILGLYLCNPAFLALSGFFFLALIVSKVTYNLFIFDLSEDFFTLLFVMSIWLSFEMGILIKRQFANFRTCLFPRYRRVHAAMAVVLFFFFMVSVALWRKGINVFFLVNLQEYVGMTSACLFVYLLIIYVAYLSIGRLVFISYFVLVLAAGQTQAIIDYLGKSPEVSRVLLGLTFLLGCYFLRRLLTLKEDSFEYPFLLTWPQKGFAGSGTNSVRFFSWGQERDGQKTFVPYNARRNLISRALHWDILERKDILSIGILLLALTPVFSWYVRGYAGPESVYFRPFSNFLIFAVAPVLTALCLTYKKMSLWAYDLLKPVDKNAFMAERGVRLSIYLLASWLLFCLYFALIPLNVFPMHAWLTQKFWIYLLLTAVYAYLILAWIAYLAAVAHSHKVIANGVLLVLLTQGEFMLMPYATPKVLTVNVFLALSGGILLTRLAYRKWCAAEG